MQAAWHIRHRGTTQAQIAAGASKNHAMGAKNPLAQYRFEVTPEQVTGAGAVQRAQAAVSVPTTRTRPAGAPAAAPRRS